MTQALRCQFGGLAVNITCSDTAVFHTLHHHFQHCLSQTFPPLAHYHIQQTAHNWQLQLDQTSLQTAVNPHALFEPLLQDALQRLITPQQQHLIFHAGCVACAEQGVLLCAATGAGKSTLVAQLIMAGFDYLTDEVIALPLDKQQMSGFARSLVLKSGSEFLWQTAPRNNEILLLPGSLPWITPAFFRADCVRHQARPKLLLFPHFEANCSLAIRPLSSAESAFHLMQHLVNARNLSQHGLPTVKKLAREIPAYEIRFGDGLAVAAWIYQQLKS